MYRKILFKTTQIGKRKTNGVFCSLFSCPHLVFEILIARYETPQCRTLTVTPSTILTIFIFWPYWFIFQYTRTMQVSHYCIYAMTGTSCIRMLDNFDYVPCMGSHQTHTQTKRHCELNPSGIFLKFCFNVGRSWPIKYVLNKIKKWVCKHECFML